MSPAPSEFGGLTYPLITELVWLNFAHGEPGHHAIAHLHHFFQLDVILEGVRMTRVENLPVRAMTRGDAVFIPPLCEHEFWSEGGFKHASFKLHLNWRVWSMLASQVMFFTPTAVSLAALEEAGQQYTAQQSFSFERVVSAATFCMIDLMRLAEQRGEGNTSFDDFRRQLLPLLEQIAQQPHAGWTVASMAEACHLSTSWFSYCFKQVLGRPPQQLITETRLRAAASDLLHQPTRSIKSIANGAGYASVQAFTRAFHRAFSIGPAGYRKLWSTRYRPMPLTIHSPQRNPSARPHSSRRRQPQGE